MNYIKHLNKVFQFFDTEEGLRANHVSLYMALFREWNQRLFVDEFHIYRGDIMKLAKIKTPSMYHRCIWDLHNWGYLAYSPSRNPVKGSRIEMKSYVERELETSTSSPAVEEPNKTDLSFNVLDCSIKGQDTINKAQAHSNIAQACSIGAQEGSLLEHGCSKEAQAHSIKGHVPIIKNKNINNKISKRPASEKECLAFFRTNCWLPLEAQKFYHHYESIGWKKGGTSDLANWKAAARSWMLRSVELPHFQSTYPKSRYQDNLKTTKFKDYGEPL